MDTTPLWLALLAGFAPGFTAPSMQLFINIATSWVLCPGPKRITRLVVLAEPGFGKAHDAYHRFFRDGAWVMNAVWRILATLLFSMFYPHGLVSLHLDDTLFHKSGRKMAGAAWWRDAVRSTATKVLHGYGLNLVLLSVEVNPPWGGEPLSLPVNMRIHRKNEKTLLELACEMLNELREWFPERKFELTADGFYAPLAKTLPAQITLISRMRRDAAIFAPPGRPKKAKKGRPRKKGDRLPIPQQIACSVKGWKSAQVNMRGKLKKRLVFSGPVIWYAVCPDRPVLLVISRDPEGIEEDDFLFCADVTADPAHVVSAYASRWAIEDTFRNVKQCLGGQDPQCWKRQGPERAAAFGFLIYSLVWTAYLKTHTSRPVLRLLPWQTNKISPSFADALAEVRRGLWRERFFARSGKKPIPAKIIHALIEALAAA